MSSPHMGFPFASGRKEEQVTLEARLMYTRERLDVLEEMASISARFFVSEFCFWDGEPFVSTCLLSRRDFELTRVFFVA